MIRDQVVEKIKSIYFVICCWFFCQWQGCFHERWVQETQGW
jgi:hypothetical protein